MLRRLIKTGVASVLHWSGTDSLFALRASVKRMPLVIGYHRVVEDFRSSATHTIAPMLISTRTFERHLDWIGRRFEFVTLDDLALWAEGGRRFDRPVAAITFDDGYGDFYHHAFPILRRKGIPAAVFVVTDLVGTPGLQIHDELYLLLASAFSHWHHPRRELLRLLLALDIPSAALRKVDAAASNSFRATSALLENLSQEAMGRVTGSLRAMARVPENATEGLQALSWEMLREMSRAGITVGSHSRTHARLTQETWRKVVEETKGSRREAQQKLGTPVEHFAYPNGIFDASVVNAVAAAGYRCAYTSCQHRDLRHPELTIPRRLLWENSCMNAFGRFSSSVMSCQVSGVFDFIPTCRQAHGF